jgi:CSLREA domain-containing protein
MHDKPRSIFPARSRSIVIGIILGTLALSAKAATLTVTSTADSGGTCPGADCTLRKAIAAANPGDTIDFSLPANTVINLTSGELIIAKSLTIAGPGANLLEVRGHREGNLPFFRVFDVSLPSGNVTISGLMISNGGADYGGGIYYNSANTSLNIAGCAITANAAGVGGGAINVSGGVLTITDSVIFGNKATGGAGGGIFVSNGSTATVTNTTISQNSASQGGGISNSRGTVTLTNSTIAQNQGSTSQSDAGGGVFSGGDGAGAPLFSVGNTIIAGNTPDDFVGQLTSQGYNLIGNTQHTQITGTTTGNQLNVNPMLGPLQNNGGPTFTHALLSGSSAIDAGNSSGSITDQRGLARPVDSPTTLNASGGDGSDIGAYEVQPDQLPGCNTINTVVSNNNDSGAGSLRAVIANVCNGSTITFANNVRGAINLTSGELAFNKSLTINGPGASLLNVQRSSAAGTPAFRVFNIGSGVFNPGYTAKASISGLTIANGNVPGAFDFGGGIFSNATLTLFQVTVSGNSAGFGGGIANSGTLNLTNSTVSNNSADTGGGVHGNILNSVNSTISGNTARTDNAGGINAGTVSLINTTVVHNTAAGSGGGVNNQFGGSVRARNCIIALNTAASGPDVSGPLTSENFNLVGNASGGTITPSQFADQLGSAVEPIDPLLGPLKDNGGQTFTHALLPGSRAIDKGHSSGVAIDQRGFTRPSNFLDVTDAQGGDGADIGAFEVPAPAPTPSPTPTSTPAPTPVTTLANISTRLRVETGDNVLIGGFIVTGTQPKKIIVRAIGTSLPLADKLANPTLELHGPNGLIEANDNWVDSPNKQAIIDSTIPPSNDLESAIVAILPANGAAYTAIVRGANGSTGIGVVEAYDLDTTASSRLANISTRGFVSTGDNVLIAGTIVVGPASQKVLIRGIGPSLPVAGKMADPTLELRDSNGAVMQANDNWVDSPNKQAIIDTTVPPSNDLESAIIATLPGNNASYTAILRGVNNTTGIAVVEVYALQ